jgi:hypothetical protein
MYVSDGVDGFIGRQLTPSAQDPVIRATGDPSK